MKITIEGSIIGYSFGLREPDQITWSLTSDPDPKIGGSLVIAIPHKFEVEVPDDMNLTVIRLSALQAERERVCKEFAASVREIDTRISKLQALEFDGAAA